MITALYSGAERVPHLSLDTAVGPLTSAPFPRRKDGNWVLALSPRGEGGPRSRHAGRGPGEGSLAHLGPT
jgi:hypothetical protein